MKNFASTLFFWITVFRLCVVSHSAWNNEDDCRNELENVDPSLVRSRRSKYVRERDWGFVGGGTSSISIDQARQECRDRSLSAPEVAHYFDFLALQVLGRELVRVEGFFTDFDGAYVIGLGEVYDYGRREVLLSNGNPAFTLWASDPTPEPAHDEDDNHQMVLNAPDRSGGYWYFGEDDLIRHGRTQNLRLVCMYPHGTYCYRNSDEEGEYARAASRFKKAEFLPLFKYNLGSGEGRDWFISSLPMSYREAEEECESVEGELWLGDRTQLQPNEFRQLKEEAESFLFYLDLKPTSQFFAGNQSQISFRPDGSMRQSHFAKNSRFFALCVEEVFSC